MKPTIEPDWDAIVVGGGPAGATAAHTLAAQGARVLLLDRGGRIKPCGGAIPPRLIRDFAIPDHLLVAKARAARMISPRDRRVDIPIDDGFVGMVDRAVFDEWLRARAMAAGAVRCRGTYERLDHDADGVARVHWRTSAEPAGRADIGADVTVNAGGDDDASTWASARTRCVIGADGARSAVARDAIPGAASMRYVFAYHEVIETPGVVPADYDGSRCEVHYRGSLSPDFYGWVFPHGGTLSVGSGSADRGFSLRQAVRTLRETSGLAEARTLRREGAPIPMQPLRRWDNGRDVVLAGDAAGVVAPASGEGIYYAMLGGQLAAEAVAAMLREGDARALASARRRFMRDHGRVFWILGLMQRFWYRNDRRRERFVHICQDRDVQQLTFEAYMHKALVRARPMAHLRIFLKDMAHLLGVARV